MTSRTLGYLLSEHERREGESDVLHHLTGWRVRRFAPMSHFGTADAARSRAASVSNGAGGKWNHYAVRLKLGRTAVVHDSGTEHGAHHYLRARHESGEAVFSKSEVEHHRSRLRGMREKAKNRYVAQHLRAKGVHSLRYVNQIEDPGSTSYVVTHPSQVRVIRSRENARVNVERGMRHTNVDFDPFE